jgi:HAMP domain-containing protein
VAEKLSGEQTLSFARKRVHEILAGLEAIAAGDFGHKLPLSPKGDELDAIAHAINVIADELRLARDRS